MRLPTGDKKGANRPDVLNHYPDRSDLWFTLAAIALGVVVLVFIVR